jgi:ketosteroid isomerase-like protein
MSQENVEIVRRYYELLNARDLVGCSELLADEFELHEPSLPDAGTFRGAGGLRLWLERLDEAWSQTRWEPEEFIEAGEFVVVPVRFHSTGLHTGLAQVSRLRFQTLRLLDGRITWATGYGKLTSALRAAGVSEPSKDA